MKLRARRGKWYGGVAGELAFGQVNCAEGAPIADAHTAARMCDAAASSAPCDPARTPPGQRSRRRGPGHDQIQRSTNGQHGQRLWAARVGLIIVGSVVLLLGLTTICQARAENDLRELPAPGRLLQVDGHAMHLWCAGSGARAVLLVSGNVSYSLDWTLVQPALSNTTRVCSYDRAGLGWSEPNPGPRTASRIADELAALIAASGEQPPFVVVGHSYGGIIARLFVARQRADVAGLVLVDAVDGAWLEQLQPNNAGVDSMLMISDGLVIHRRSGEGRAGFSCAGCVVSLHHGASSAPVAAYSPHTKSLGSRTSPRRELNQKACVTRSCL
jgi:hypothetical protein